MARFRDSAAPLLPDDEPGRPEVRDRAIGEIIRDRRALDDDQVAEILAHQRENGIRFGEAAVALGHATRDDVLYALAQQFHYPYVPEDQRGRNPELPALTQPFSMQAEALRAIRSQVITRLFADGQARAALAVISPDMGDGKTFLSANLAIAMAQLGGRTLLVDADLRGPRQHQVFGVDNSAGLSGVLSGRTEAKVIQQVAAMPSLYVLPVGVTPPNPLELVERPAFGLLMKELTTKFDHVVVDTPAAAHGADASVIAARCGSALVVARRNASRTRSLHELVVGLSGSPARLAGVVLNEH